MHLSQPKKVKKVCVFFRFALMGASPQTPTNLPRSTTGANTPISKKWRGGRKIPHRSPIDMPLKPHHLPYNSTETVSTVQPYTNDTY